MKGNICDRMKPHNIYVWLADNDGTEITNEILYKMRWKQSMECF